MEGELASLADTLRAKRAELHQLLDARADAEVRVRRGVCMRRAEVRCTDTS